MQHKMLVKITEQKSTSTSCYISMHLKNIKIREFLYVHFTIKDGKNRVLGMLCFIILRNVKLQLKSKKEKICVMYGEGAMTNRKCQSGL